MYQTIRYEKQDGIAIVTINRPEALNALNSTVISELEQVIGEVEKDQELGAMILTGEGRSFVAGADIGEQYGLDVAAGRKWGQRGSALFRRIEKLEIPTIAAVNGFALGGGCELAMSCDIRVASEKATFGMPEVGLGITPGFGGTQRLQRIVGMSTAMELVLTSRTIDAQEALQIGLVKHVYPADVMLDKALELADLIASRPQVAVRQAKQAIRIGKQIDINSAIAFESEAFGLCFSTEDQKDAMHAFLNKEKITTFKNR